jgi:hypothetical protein
MGRRGRERWRQERAKFFRFGRRALRQSERARRKIGLEKTAAVCVFCEMGGDGKGRTPDASCESGQAIEKAQNVMGGYWKKLAWIWLWRRSRVGLAPTPAWVWRHVRFDGTMPTVGAIRAIKVIRLLSTFALSSTTACFP